MTNRERWLTIANREAALGDQDEHVYSQRFAMICQDILEKIQADPNFEPPTYQEVMAKAPWGP